MGLVVLLQDGPDTDLPDYGDQLVRMVWALGTLLAVFALAAWLLPRLLKRRPLSPRSGRMELVETLRLDARRSLHLVRVDGRTILIGAGEGGLVRLAALEDPTVEPQTAERAFADMLVAQDDDPPATERFESLGT